MITNDELLEFNQSIFTGVIVGVGSLVLLFSSGTRIMIQCPFQCGQKAHLFEGHGEDVATSNLLFPFLNLKIKTCSILDGEILELAFGNQRYIYIIPESSGFESYVITTSRGDYPIITY
ncbi:hypothetical protein MUA01_02775 [Enterobacteriaceae bacterium H18W14]|uniref:hypothetical protein n=1 Tax=Dryocola boscaweniae TaxID=2925397 RepID=UPI0022F0E693|nr:hypothetical protein [Dryocola boscaweniae]MCT4713919.1 hypothetical protein [Dryocola boscaweniae]